MSTEHDPTPDERGPRPIIVCRPLRSDAPTGLYRPGVLELHGSPLPSSSYRRWHMPLTDGEGGDHA